MTANQRVSTTNDITGAELLLPTFQLRLHIPQLFTCTVMTPRAIAFYLPQYHPIPENDEWWGKGFTEWTNVAKAKPLYPGHHQPHLPADLGFYDLRVPEVRQAQADLARHAGIEGFCYYHYWFSGRRLLERPFTEVLESGEPDFPFCLCWANETWTGIWHGSPEDVLIKQTYPGKSDHRAHFDALLPAFKDTRYIRVNNKPLFFVYKPNDLPDAKHFATYWRHMAVEAGLNGLFLIGTSWTGEDDPSHWGFDASLWVNVPPVPRFRSLRRPFNRLVPWLLRNMGVPSIYLYRELLPKLLPTPPMHVNSYPCVIPNWDNTPRSKERGRVFHGSTPELFRKHVRQAMARIEDRDPEERLLFIKSWNEWAEGNYLEPDERWGHQYLNVLRDELT